MSLSKGRPLKAGMGVNMINRQAYIHAQIEKTLSKYLKDEELTPLSIKRDQRLAQYFLFLIENHLYTQQSHLLFLKFNKTFRSPFFKMDLPLRKDTVEKIQAILNDMVWAKI